MKRQNNKLKQVDYRDLFRKNLSVENFQINLVPFLQSNIQKKQYHVHHGVKKVDQEREHEPEEK